MKTLLQGNSKELVEKFVAKYAQTTVENTKVFVDESSRARRPICSLETTPRAQRN